MLEEDSEAKSSEGEGIYLYSQYPLRDKSLMTWAQQKAKMEQVDGQQCMR